MELKIIFIYSFCSDMLHAAGIYFLLSIAVWRTKPSIIVKAGQATIFIIRFLKMKSTNCTIFVSKPEYGKKAWEFYEASGDEKYKKKG